MDRLEHSVRRDLKVLEAASAVDAAWRDLQRIELNNRQLARARVVSRHKSDPSHAAFDMLRTRIMRAMAERAWRSLMITSPTPGCGKTTVALNLAFSLSRRSDGRIMLLELDFVRPSIGRLLGLGEKPSIVDVLAGTAEPQQCLLRCEDRLVMGVATSRRKDSAELLQSALAGAALLDMARRYAPEVIICDLPPLFAIDDALAFAPRVDCALVVAAEGETALEEIDDCVEQLSRVTNVLGVVMNKSVHRERGYYGQYGYGR